MKKQVSSSLSFFYKLTDTSYTSVAFISWMNNYNHIWIMVCNYSSMRDVFTKRFEVRENGNGLTKTSYRKSAITYSCMNVRWARLVNGVPGGWSNRLRRRNQSYPSLNWYSWYNYIALIGRWGWLNALWPSDALWRRQHVVYKTHIFHYERIPSNLRYCDFFKVDIIIF